MQIKSKYVLYSFVAPCSRRIFIKVCSTGDTRTTAVTFSFCTEVKLLHLQTSLNFVHVLPMNTGNKLLSYKASSFLEAVVPLQLKSEPNWYVKLSTSPNSLSVAVIFRRFGLYLFPSRIKITTVNYLHFQLLW